MATREVPLLLVAVTRTSDLGGTCDGAVAAEEGSVSVTRGPPPFEEGDDAGTADGADVAAITLTPEGLAMTWTVAGLLETARESRPSPAGDCKDNMGYTKLKTKLLSRSNAVEPGTVAASNHLPSFFSKYQIHRMRNAWNNLHHIQWRDIPYSFKHKTTFFFLKNWKCSIRGLFCFPEQAHSSKPEGLYYSSGGWWVWSR